MWPSSLLNKRRSNLLPPESSNMEEVEGNADLLAIILVQLPAKSIFRFRCVSKRWNNTICTPSFFQAYYNTRKAKRRTLAYIQTIGVYLKMLRVPPNDHNIDINTHGFLDSSNGIILCQNWRRPPTLKYYIMNPLTKKCVLLPPNPNRHDVMIWTLMCEENAGDLVLSYKVIAVGEFQEGSSLVVETFSSNTWRWTTSKLTTPSGFIGLNDYYSLGVDGIIHWLALDGDEVAVYDSNQEKTAPSLEMIKLPCKFEKEMRFARASRNDPLWFCVDTKKCVRMWMLPNTGNKLAKREWLLMHNINYHQQLFETIISKGGIWYPEWWAKSGLSTALAGLVPWESPLVALLTIVDDILIHHINLESMTYEQVQFPVHEGPHQYRFYHYMEPLCLSSYTL